MLQLAQAFHPVLLLAVRAGETAAWLATLLAGLLALGLFRLLAAAVAARPGGTLITVARDAAGGTGAVVTGLLVTFLFSAHAGLVIRETAEMTISSTYPHTPQTFAMVALALCGLFGAYGRLPGLLRLCRVFLPFGVLGLLLLLIGSVGWGEARWLLPLFGPGLGTLLLRTLGLTSIYTPVVLFFLVTAGELRDRRHLWRSGALAIGGGGLLLTLTMVVLVMTYPLPLGRSVTFPLHHMARLVIGGRFFERVEGLWVLIWAFGTVAYLAVIFHTAAAAYASVCALPSYRVAVPSLVAIAVTLALIPPDQGRTLSWHYAAAPIAVAISFALPVALVALAAWRGHGVKHVR